MFRSQTLGSLVKKWRPSSCAWRSSAWLGWEGERGRVVAGFEAIYGTDDDNDDGDDDYYYYDDDYLLLWLLLLLCTVDVGMVDMDFQSGNFVNLCWELWDDDDDDGK